MQNKNIFITGATGFIGNKLALELCVNNRVSALVRPESMEKAGQLKKSGINIIPGNLLEDGTYASNLDGVDYVFHLAALFKLDASREQLYKYNVLGTETLLKSCRDKGIKKIVYFSTAYVTGTRENDLMTEDEPCNNRFKNYYEWSKAEAESAVLGLSKKYDLPIVIVRPVIVYGQGSRYGFYDAVYLISNKKLLVLPAGGKNKIHLVHVDDVISAALHLSQLKNTTCQIYNICDSYPHTSKELVYFIADKYDVVPPVISVPGFVAKIASRMPMWKIFFKNIPAELLDYFLYNQTYSNSKIKSTGYAFKYDNAFEGLKNVLP